MNQMNNMLPLIMILAMNGTDKDKTNKTFQAMMPAILPLPIMHRAVMATVIAGQTAKQDKSKEEVMAQDAANAIALTGVKITQIQLDTCPKLAEVLERRPDLKRLIVKKD